MATQETTALAIVGGGIGGLATALALHGVGVRATVFEQAATIRELGVGLNVLPPAVAVLGELGLAEPLAAAGVATQELLLAARDGTMVRSEPRGLDAGHPVPQLSIHRGRLQGVLLAAVLDRLGPGAVRCGRRLVGLEPQADGVELVFETPDGVERARAGALVGADGIHSSVRAALHPEEGPPHWNGSLIWRGATPFPAFLTGRSMLITGGMDAKFVLYPIAPPAPGGEVLTNWALVRKVAEDGARPPARESWSRTASRAVVAAELGHVRVGVLDPFELVAATDPIYEYPMCDRDPLPSWAEGPVTLLGDAAHPMYPVGSNGATQAILDAACLAGELQGGGGTAEAFAHYEALRRPTTAEIVLGNRSGGPEGVIDDYEREHLGPLP